MSIAMYAGVAGVVSSLALALLWQAEKTENAKLKGLLDGKDQNIAILKSSIESQREHFEKTMKLADSNSELLTNFDNIVKAVKQKVEILENAINKLRAEELENAMQDRMALT